ncbi:prolyl oligopeptidase family serine peptidase [Mucilaginibacter sp.]|uniref:alpha/beta hydrolase family protein n=1 Tax=Mucilaginibacter sp. TaxID=1882438 RepID=UPI0026146B3F|nr:prolyl oligopeptidase family serine peptidase [Mucilaginibacter sp.]MDB4925506.1 hypothetical protein [Mucilaginibacter sp.]
MQTSYKIAKCCVSVIIICLLFTVVVQAQKRPYTVNDMLNLESYCPCNLSPDGQWLTVAHTPSPVQRYYNDHTYFPDADNELLLFAPATKQTVNVTKLLPDSSAAWGPSWSPGSDKLAFLSLTRDAPNCDIRCYIRQTKKIVTLKGYATFDHTAITWVSDTEVVLPVYNTKDLNYSSVSLAIDVDKATPRIAAKGWRDQIVGRNNSASVLNSDTVVNYISDLRKAILVKWNVQDNRVWVLETVSMDNSSSKIYFSADKKNIAVPVLRKLQPLGSVKLLHLFDNKAFGLVIYRNGRKVVSKKLDSIKQIAPQSLQWSPDGNQIAFTGTCSEVPLTANGLYKIEKKQGSPSSYDKLADFSGGPSEIWIYDIRQDLLNKIQPNNINLFKEKKWYNYISLKYKWGTDNRLVVYGKNEGSPRNDWWHIDDKTTCLTCKFKNALIDLQAINNGWIGISQDSLWKIAINGLEVKNISHKIKISFTSLLPIAGLDSGKILVRLKTPGKENETVALLNTANEQIERKLVSPALNTVLNDYNDRSHAVVYSRTDTTGSTVWIGKDNKSEVRFQANQWLKEIINPEKRSFNYVSTDRDTLRAWLLLPAGYRKGQKAPLITWVYQGIIQPNTSLNINEISRFVHDNQQFFAAKGYAVLFPSMPGHSGDMNNMVNNVMPAVDSVIAMGIADPEKLVVAGQSGGGFSTYGIITQTNRFKSAISMNGVSDYLTQYLTFNTRYRYGDYPLNDIFNISYSESGAHGFGSTPWGNLQTYIQNSPVFFADRVKTPVLIMQGDLDYVSILNGEEFYTALYRMGKKARFVRYWGEDHVFQSPANIRHMWNEIDKWLKETGCAPEIKP